MKAILTRLPSWDLARKQEDIRGWKLEDDGGRALGTVRELVVDTHEKHVIGVVLGDGHRYSAHDILIGDRVLKLAMNGYSAQATPSTPTKPLAAGAGAMAGGAGAVAASAASKTASAAGSAASAVKRAIDPSLARASDKDLVVPLVDEEIAVGKRRIDAGGVRIQTHTVGRPAEADVTLREEHVRVERRATDLPLSGIDAEARLRDATIEMTAEAEVPVIDKRAHVVEEIRITKEATERTERVHDTVRHTEVEVVDLPKSIKGTDGGKL